ncbi:YgaP family membrane protein [Muriicola sp.]|uniref:YgaP family membrane protein n=1 Tax=Muriicola sp. TaxID=2020856 RepID=UPI003C775059
MKTNMGALDKIIRVIIAIAAGFLVYYDVVQGVYSYILLTIVAIFLLTSLVGFCPLYSIFGLNTCSVNKKG